MRLEVNVCINNIHFCFSLYYVDSWSGFLNAEEHVGRLSLRWLACNVCQLPTDGQYAFAHAQSMWMEFCNVIRDAKIRFNVHFNNSPMIVCCMRTASDSINAAVNSTDWELNENDSKHDYQHCKPTKWIDLCCDEQLQEPVCGMEQTVGHAKHHFFRIIFWTKHKCWKSVKRT